MDIIPSYKCNLRCPFCFNKDNWKTNGILDLQILEKELADNTIKELAIIGGEPSLLPEDYLIRLINICKTYLKGENPDFYTNLVHIPSEDVLSNVNLHVSYDPCDRTMQKTVLNNMMKLNCDFSINMIITKNLIYNYGIEKIVKLANRFKQPLYLSKINVVTINGIKHMQPLPEDIVKFTIDLYEQHNPYIKSSLLRVLNKTYKHNKPSVERFDYNVSINPDGRFQTSGLHGINKIYKDTYKECYEAYKEIFKTPDKCKTCKFNEYCIDEYRNGYSCDDDRMIMEKFEEYYNEYIC